MTLSRESEDQAFGRIMLMFLALSGDQPSRPAASPSLEGGELLDRLFLNYHPAAQSSVTPPKQGGELLDVHLNH